jgi:hypothetical protein
MCLGLLPRKVDGAPFALQVSGSSATLPLTRLTIGAYNAIFVETMLDWGNLVVWATRPDQSTA